MFNNNGIRVNQQNQVVLCGDRICCPRMERTDNGQYALYDDFGGKVLLTKDQIGLVADGAKACDQIKGEMVSEETLLFG